jgi:hypothetical protein
MSRASRYLTLTNSYGFLPSEAMQLSHVSKAGTRAPYFQRMINSRRSLYLNAKRYGWTQTEYRDAIKRQYSERGAFKQDVLGRIRADVWQLLRWYEDKTPDQERYESPWRKRTTKRSGQRKTQKSLSRRQMYTDWIRHLTLQINDPNTSEKQRDRLKSQRNNFQQYLDKLQ